jgi:Zn-dependent alcohol dehydrogenase
MNTPIGRPKAPRFPHTDLVCRKTESGACRFNTFPNPMVSLIPKLITLYKDGQFPIDKIIKLALR